MKQTVNPISSIGGKLVVPGDKSISHRAIMIGSLAEGNTEVVDFLNADDCLSTISVFQQLGVNISKSSKQSYIIKGNGLYGLKEPKEILYVGNSGTTIRLTAGILSGQNFHSVITGDSSIVKRPMKRIAEPLTKMGAKIDGRENGNYAPLSISGNKLNGIQYSTPVASAQVKSSILLAGLYADKETTVIEPSLSRDHTEKMLTQFGAKLSIDQREVTIWPGYRLTGQKIIVPGDFSSAAFFIAAALIVPKSELRINNVGLNNTRIGFLDAVKLMGGDIEIIDYKNYGYEPVGDIIVKSSSLKGINITGEIIPKLIDELPLIAILASRAEGRTVVRDASELRVKETDRITAIVKELRNIGVEIEEMKDGFSVEGKQSIVGGFVSSHKDHRIGMALAIAGLISKKGVVIEEANAINISYPQFFEDLNKISKY